MSGFCSSLKGFLGVRKRDVCADMEADENIAFTGETPLVLQYQTGQKGIDVVAANNLRLVAALFDQQKLEITHREQMERRYL